MATTGPPEPDALQPSALGLAAHTRLQLREPDGSTIPGETKQPVPLRDKNLPLRAIHRRLDLSVVLNRTIQVVIDHERMSRIKSAGDFCEADVSGGAARVVEDYAHSRVEQGYWRKMAIRLAIPAAFGESKG